MILLQGGMVDTHYQTILYVVIALLSSGLTFFIGKWFNAVNDHVKSGEEALSDYKSFKKEHDAVVQDIAELKGMFRDVAEDVARLRKVADAVLINLLEEAKNAKERRNKGRELSEEGAS